MRAAFILSCFVVGAVVSHFFGPYIVKNDQAIGIFVTVYTVFAGFLVAVITILGDPALLPSGTWRNAEIHRKDIEDRLIRHTYLFILYLITIGLIFVGALLADAPDKMVPSHIKAWIAYGHLTFGVAAFLLSMALPKMLMDIQRKRVDAEIERRREEAGIKPDSTST